MARGHGFSVAQRHIVAQPQDASRMSGNAYEPSASGGGVVLDATSLVGRLADIGIALTSIRSLDRLLEHIVVQACDFASCDGGTVYIREGDCLRLAVWRNAALARRSGRQAEVVHEGMVLPVSSQWIAGYVAAQGQVLNLPDVYRLPPGSPFAFDPSFDRENDYLTQSMLCVPMNDATGDNVGALQLVNAVDGPGRVVAFPTAIEPLVRSLASQAAVAIRNAQLDEKLKAAYFDTILRLSVAAEYRDTDTSRHVRRVSLYAEAIALECGMTAEQAELVRFAAPMHDIGKLGIPDAILLKPAALTPAERQVMQEHTRIGYDILKDSDAEVIRASAEVALAHHERWDGQGYPSGLSGGAIPQLGRIVALADAFDCISSRRVYKEPRSVDESEAIVRGDSGSHFDPACVEAFVRARARVEAIHESLADEAPAPPLTGER